MLTLNYGIAASLLPIDYAMTWLVSFKVWDVRSMVPVMEVNVHNDFISDMTDNRHKTLIAVRSVA